MKLLKKQILGYTLILFFFNYSISQVSNNELKAEVDAIFSKHFNDSIPGAAVAILKNGELIITSGYGMANMEYNIPITSRTRFHLVSASKQFTAFAILKLEQQGVLSLKDDIRKYIPELHDFGFRITIEHLLTHTSGLRQETSLESIVGYWKSQAFFQERALELILNQRELNFEPGSKFRYSNSGWTLLAEIIERVTKEPFGTWMKKKIFEPIKMFDTSIITGIREIIPNRADSYDKNKNGYFKDSGNLWAFYGGTGVYSNALDLSKWLLYLDNPSPNDINLIEKMQQPAVLNNGDEITWGLGLIINKGIGGETKLWHSGDSAGYHTWIGRYPESKLGIIILSNYDAFDPKYAADQIAELFISKNNKEEVSIIPKINDETLITNPNTITGYYKSIPTPYWYIGELWQVLQKNNQVFFSPSSGVNIPIKLNAKSLFELENTPLKILFSKDSESQLKLTLIGPDGNQDALKINDESYSLSELEILDYKGKYLSPELNIEYEIFISKGELKVKHNTTMSNRLWWDFDLKPLSKDYFVSNRSFFTYVKFERNTNGEVIGLRVTNNNERVEKLWFKKL